MTDAICPQQILLVEDDPRDAELILDVLAICELSQKVVHVCDGAEALDFLYRKGRFADRGGETPNVVLLDLKMPKVDGFEVLRRMKSDPAFDNVEVIVMTSSRRELDWQESRQSGAKACVVKPDRFLEFVDKIRQIGLFYARCYNQPRAAEGNA